MTDRSIAGSWNGQTWEELKSPVTGKWVTSSGPHPHDLSWIDSVTHGANVPGWREKLRSGGDATTSLSGYKASAGSVAGNAETILGGVPYRLTGMHMISMAIPSNDPATLDEAKADAEALSKFNRSIQNVRATVMGGVVLGELGQTLRMIRRPAQGLRKLTDEFLDIARAIRNRRIRGSLTYAYRHNKLTEALSDAWLEAQFGWKPLISDVRDGCKALDAFNTGHGLQTRRVTGRYTDKGTSAEQRTVVGFSFNLVAATRLETSVSFVYRGGMRVAAKNPGDTSLDLWGLGPRDWLPTAWELIPYSFLIDYFTNIGDLILGWSNIGVDLAWCNRTMVKTFRRVSWSEKHPSYVITPFTSARFIGEKRYVSRAKYTGLTNPGFTFRVPGSGSMRWLNLAALIGSRNADRRWSYD